MQGQTLDRGPNQRLKAHIGGREGGITGVDQSGASEGRRGGSGGGTKRNKAY